MKLFKKVASLIVAFMMSSNIAFAGMLDGRKIVLDAGHGGKQSGAYYYNIKEKDLNIAIIEKLSNILKNFGAEIIFTRKPNNDVFVELKDRANIANSNSADMFISVHNNASASAKVNGTEVYYSTNRVNNKKFVLLNGIAYQYLREIKINDVDYVYYLEGNNEAIIEKSKVKIVYRYVELEGNRYEYLREEKIDDVDYVYILVDNKEQKVEKSKVKIVDSNVAFQALESIDLAKLIVSGISSVGFANKGAKNSNFYVVKYTTMPSVLIEAGYMTNAEEIKKLSNPDIQEKIAYKIADAVYRYYEEYEKSKRRAFGFIKSLNLKISKRLLLVGQAVDLELEGLDDTSKYLYRVEIKRNGENVYSTEYGQATKVNYIPNKEGIYDVTFYIKSVDSSNDYDDKITGNYVVCKDPTIKSLNLSGQKVNEKNPVSINVEVQNGSYEGVIYKFEVYSGERLISTQTNTTGVLTYNPQAAGEYRVIAYVKDKLSDKEYDDKKEVKLLVEKQEEMSRGNSAPQENKIQLVYTRTLKKGVKGTDVVQLQLALQRLGYYKAKSTTLEFDANTEAAVKAFQKANKLTADGIVGKGTIVKLNSALGVSTVNKSNTTNTINTANTSKPTMQLVYKRVLRSGSVGEDVRQLQQALKILGYFKYSTTTKFSSTTLNAVRAFQKANKLNANGIVDKKTVDKINERLRSR
ncbi:N-acetylmuramoyl-L-alanine amidase [Thermobrachium celere]|uniref:N-acetylmuramoyl-L-alanine amidase n=1 Tax=Thermobrachium celere DSM 8682 TaxID=941824 RepID=R7RR44_9CLOT|nr:N-acetylmuramoyl-L-alanine amidase [Thermobrachium celere]CDF57773.1 N-acetylmuramoyl-L-alanine amidase [Thermobrachium celere DSM 8682]